MERLHPLINELSIQRHIMHGKESRSILLQNYTPDCWWECDLMQITTAGFWVEYEVKLTRSDFKADGNKKVSTGWDADTHKPKHKTKHEKISEADPARTTPNNFYFVTPKGMLHADEIPEWAGLIEMHVRDNTHFLLSEITKKAPRIHTRRVSCVFERGTISAGYRRYHWMKSQKDWASEQRIINSLEKS